jgi:hypothetical protein
VLPIRHNARAGERVFYPCWLPEPVPVLALACVPGIRWATKELFQNAIAEVER